MTETQNRLVGALIGMARATDGNEHLITESSTEAIVISLRALERAGEGELQNLLGRVTEEKRCMVPDCFSCAAPCGKNSDYDMARLNQTPEELQALKYTLLEGIRHMASGEGLSFDAQRFLYKALILIGMEDLTAEDLKIYVSEMEQIMK